MFCSEKYYSRKVQTAEPTWLAASGGSGTLVWSGGRTRSSAPDRTRADLLNPFETKPPVEHFPSSGPAPGLQPFRSGHRPPFDAPSVGQCGNQLGEALWQTLGAQRNLGEGLYEDGEFFRSGSDGKKVARCLLVDTEPKVHDASKMFSNRRCYLGQSGRGNNWSFGYNQVLAADPTRLIGRSVLPQQGEHGLISPKGGNVHTANVQHTAAWNSSAVVEDPSAQEFHILEKVVDGRIENVGTVRFVGSVGNQHDLGNAGQL
eukprot:gene20309-27065_t